ncbi:MAG TPA: cytochrome c oxidase subunit II [Hyphomicrobiaceae bacterium]|nr:cytochrome c oxidase subunit II [Hyphomicrobiaceae bacterium]
MFEGIRRYVLAMAAAIATTVGAPALALAQMGQPAPWQYTMQDAATPVAAAIHWFHDFVNVIIIAIAAFVLILLAIVVWRFNERSNPTPSRITHNTMLEVVWTVIPVIILIVIAIPSFRLLYFQYSYPQPDLTIKAIGNAWFWEHEYPDQGGFRVTSNMLRDEDVLRAELGDAEFAKRYSGLEGIERQRRLYADAAPVWAKRGLVRQLSVDNEIAVPVNKVVLLLVTANDVIHAWTIPSFGSKVDAVPGRLTATWFRPERTGIYYGQCSELCGKDHASMPIAVRVVSERAFNDWSGALKAAAGERDSTKRRELLNRAKEVLRQAAIEDERATQVKLAGRLQ